MPEDSRRPQARSWALARAPRGCHARRRAPALPPGRPLPDDVFTTADALRRGATQRQLEWAVETGRLHRLRRGVLCESSTWTRADPSQRVMPLARAVAASRAPGTPFAFSHATGAALLGLPVAEDEGSRIWLTVPRGWGTRRRQKSGPCRVGKERNCR
ncbi:MAG: type IV toxin-antitoxin system AbiEi family antitoxin domain-containing protein [Kineosporiaceae bacterium]